MNSYPPELLAQLAPVMFVAGLDVPSPNPQEATPSRQQDPFAVLKQRLRDALISQRKVAIWQPEKAKIFQAVLVDVDVRFPPRKLAPPEDQQYQPLHSPLSPLTPSSPLYPDGLIAPIWIRKHTTLVPSVFVLFKRIYEHPQPPPNQTGTAHADFDRDREAEERRRDTELAAEIAQRKRSTNERSIKLTAVLMASRRMLDDPALDARLTFIRRQSGLDPRAALFVLSPVTQAEIGDFVRSLQEALYEPALEYYTNHSKRVRRKRNKHSQGTVHIPVSPLGAGNSPRPLRPEGWTVRYEYKMACFAEFRGEDEVALKHYQDTYAALLVMFGSTAILPPRTKRWAEGKVLADCISVKICKLYLYNKEHAMALAHHSAHMRKFSDLSRGWGIGEETFEFWSWLSRQHRVFAELLEQGNWSTLEIPKHTPVPAPSAAKLAAQAAGPQRNAMEAEALRLLGINPTHALQHPGFYYYMAAQCTESRRERFLRALESEVRSIHHGSLSPGFANEKKVDHLAIVLELYTRAYEIFKKNSASPQGRQQLWIAYRIAQTYYASGKFDMAVRFFERIAKTYRREKWEAMLRPLLSTWYACAQQLGDMELSVQLLLEMLGHGVVVDQEDPESVQEDLLAVLKSTVPSNPEQSLVVDLTESGPLLDSTTIFWTPTISVGESSAFQITLTAPPTVQMSDLPFSSLHVHFGGDLPPVVIEHSQPEGDEGTASVQRIDLGRIHAPHPNDGPSPPTDVQANLRWPTGSSLVLTGSLGADFTTILMVTKLVLTLKQNSWTIELPLQPNSSRTGSICRPQWLSSVDPVRFLPIRGEAHSSVTVQNRPHRVSVAVAHNSPAYLGEDYPVTLDITNLDDRELNVVVDVLLHPLEVEHASSDISLDGQNSTSLVKGVALGTLVPGANITKTLILSVKGAIGDRTLDISVQSRTTGPSVANASPPSPNTSFTGDTAESLRTLVIPSVEAIKAEHTVRYKRPAKLSRGLGDLATFEADYSEDAGEAVVSTTMACIGQSGISVESAKLVREDGTRAKVRSSFIDVDEESFLSEWLTGDEFCDQCLISLSRDEDDTDDSPIPGPGHYEVSWRRLQPDGVKGSLSVSRFPLPQLRPPKDGLIALLDIPSTAKLHSPIAIHLTVRNQRLVRSANVVVQFDLDPLTDGFVVAGLRQGRLPVLLPGAEYRMTWNLIPVECGYVQIPKIKVTDRRPVIDAQLSSTNAAAIAAGGRPPQTDGEEVKIVDVRAEAVVEGSEPVVADSTRRGTILVLP
ncbi:Gryzun, putative trafficking through golgi-domain-containing protein [Cristinia sonorae]|uniref:Gryzun, putative trafficking through golgi-domain-containing protein n=1 Tax=Cristinia sonorae TaxID=1940300 RepID=A0A8K0UIH5_9AGAR|nr:Gryzun, putative trafficking through golgi-domain-containing protein [Cristinia sonorae]